MESGLNLKTANIWLLLVLDEGGGALHANHPQNLKTAATLSAFGFGVNSKEYPSVAGYARKEIAPGPADQTVNLDSAANEYELDAPDITYTGLASCTGTFPGHKAIGAVLFREVGTDAQDIPVEYYGFPVPFDGNGGNVTLQWPAEGFLKLKDTA